MAPDVREKRGIVVFVVAFGVLWTVYVAAVWRMGWVEEAFRPWLRATFWMGATALWLLWARPARPMQWLGLARLSGKAFLLTAAALATIGGWNLARVHWLMPPVDKLGTWTITAYAWSFMGVLEEELAFRGVLQGHLQSRMHWMTAIGVTSVAFVAIHVPGWLILGLPVDPSLVISVLLVSLLCGAVRHWSGSLWPAVAAHWANNLGAQL